MEYVLILIALCLMVFFGWLKWNTEKDKDFRYLIEPQLEKFGMKYIKSEYPGIFKVGPFKKFEIEIGKPQINDGSIQYEKRYYRKIIALTKNKSEVIIWAKIDTGWFKDDSVEFNPELKKANNTSRK